MTVGPFTRTVSDGTVRPCSDTNLPDGLLDAFWAYDRALLANNATLMDELFLDSEHTLRADQSGVLVGHEAIADFRRARQDRPTRVVRRLWTRRTAPDSVFTLAEVASAAGEIGLQTQLWQRNDGRWRVYAAHVTPPAAMLDPTVWRVAGAPLVPPTGDGPLRGDTVAVKDLFAVCGLPRGGGVRAYLAEQQPQDRHAAAVAALLGAGASVGGIAQTDQFAFSLGGRNIDYGTPVNLAAPTALPGGSSSGSAVAVRRGWASIGLGTDTAGSIRVPASYQALWGVRPTHGAVDGAGVLPLAPSFDTVGWLTRDAATARRVGGVLLPPDTRPLRRALVVADALVAPLSDVVRAELERAARQLGGVDRIAGLPELAPAVAAFRTIQAHEAWTEHGAWLESHPGAVANDVRERFESGRATTQGQLDDAWAVLLTVRGELDDALGDAQLLIPSASGAAPALDCGQNELDAHRTRTIALTALASFTGRPAIGVPALRDGAAPLGLCLVGPCDSDRSLLTIAAQIGTELGAE